MPESAEICGSSTEVTFRSFAFASATTVFILFGTTASLYGPLLITFSHHFNVSLPVAGAVLSVNFVGAVVGVAIGWFSLNRIRGNAVLSSALVVMALGAGAAALAPVWALFLASAFVIGVGFGAMDFTLNSLLMRTPVTGRAHRLSFANAGYGLGAVIAPVLIIAVHPHNFALLFTGMAVIALLLSTSNRGLHAPALHAEARRRAFESRNRQRRPILATFVVAYILYVALESSSAGWIAPQLHRVGYTQTVASVATAGFWLGLTIGRVGVGPLHRRFTDRNLVLGGLGLTVILAAAAFFNVLAPYSYPLIGLALASVYPMGLIWYATLCPHDADGLALMILFMMAGGVIGPGFVSLIVSIAGIHAVPVTIAIFALADLTVFASALRFRPIELANSARN